MNRGVGIITHGGGPWSVWDEVISLYALHAQWLDSIGVLSNERKKIPSMGDVSPIGRSFLLLQGGDPEALDCTTYRYLLFHHILGTGLG